ncbi:MAG: hypothetical protein FWF15_00825 [Oscillospiraceae bacterium]|nr:hypothetical protein [Oscillospiraceae bacterium]
MTKFTNEYIMRNRIKIGAWSYVSPGVTEEGMRLFTEAGLDYVIIGEGTRDPVLREKMLTLADEYGVETLVLDYQHFITAEKVEGRPCPVEHSKDYAHHPSFAGHYFGDEPGSDDLVWMGKAANEYSAVMPGKTPFMNLLPMYANAAQLKYGASASAIEYYDADPELYRKHCITFCENWDTDYISTDIYPLFWENGEGSKKTTYADYIESINQIATVAREYNRKFYCCIQTFGWAVRPRTPIENEYRWQVYAMLSFGCTGILLWRITAHNNIYESLFDLTTFEPKMTYYEFKPVGLEIQAISDVFVKYDNLGAYNVNCDESTPYLRMSGAYKDFATIAEIDTKAPLLVGCFEAKDKKSTAFTIVNMYELGKNKPAYVKIKLAENKKVTAYPYGKPIVVTPVDGYYQINLAWGQGVFVTVE